MTLTAFPGLTWDLRARPGEPLTRAAPYLILRKAIAQHAREASQARQSAEEWQLLLFAKGLLPIQRLLANLLSACVQTWS